MRLRHVFAIVTLLAPMAPGGLRAQAGTVTVDGAVLPYEIEGSGPPLVLIHGWAVNRGFWDDDVAELARHHRVIWYDRRGCGAASGKADGTADPADLKVLLEHLGVTHAAIMGHSQGAGVALTFALRYPDMVDALVLFAPGPIPGQDVSPAEDLPAVGEWATVGKTYGVDSLRAVLAQWALGGFGGPMEGIEAKAQALISQYSGADLIDPAPPSNLVPPATVEELAAVSVPTLVLHGDQDMETIQATARMLAEKIPGAQRVVISGGGHVVNWQQPERFHAEVLDFLRSTESSGR